MQTIIPENWNPFVSDNEFFYMWAVDKLDRKGTGAITDTQIQQEILTNARLDLPIDVIHRLTGKLMAEKYIECTAPYAVKTPQLRSNIQEVNARDTRPTPIGKRVLNTIFTTNHIDPDKPFTEQSENAVRQFPSSWLKSKFPKNQER